MSLARFFPIISIMLLLSVALSACGGEAFVPSGWPGLTVDNKVAYLAFNQFVYAVQVDNGSMVWRYPKDGADRNKSFFAAPVLTEDGQVIVGGYDHQLYSLDAQSGAERWSFPAKDRFVASPLVAGGRIFAPNADGNLYALDLQGNKVWTFVADSPLWATPVTDEDCSCIYLASFGHQLYSLDAQTGNPNWGPVDVGSAVVDSPALSADGTLFVGTFGKEIVAINVKANGEILWRFRTDGWIWGSPVIEGDRLYFGDIDGNFYILNIPDRSIVQKTKPDGPITSSPVVGGDNVYFATESGTIYAIDTDGNTLWNPTVGGQIHSSPGVSEELILVSPMQVDFILVGLNPGGSQKWAFIPPK